MNKKIYLLALLIAAMLLALTGCIRIGGGNSVRGTGSMVTREMDVPGNFTTLEVGGNFRVVYRQASEFSITVVMQENLFEFLEISTTEEDTLLIDSSRNFVTTSNNRPRIYIYAPYLEVVSFYGDIDAEDWDVIAGEHFVINGAGEANVSLEIEVGELEIDLTGTGNLMLFGNADVANITIIGEVNVLANYLQVNHASIDLIGEGMIDLAVSEHLNVGLIGAGRVNYTGNPTVVHSALGEGRVEQR